MADRRLTMAAFLPAVDLFGTDVYYKLTREGFHFHVIYATAEKAASKGYTEYGVVHDRPWLTDKGREFLVDARSGDMMQKCCETCRYWELPDDVDREHYDGRGTCNLIVHEDSGPKDAEAAVMDFEGYQACLRTKASFGCALWGWKQNTEQ